MFLVEHFKREVNLKDYDIIVIGGGHAGVEAAWAGANQNKTVLLITQTIDNIAQMSCNPSIGGLAKSHLVKEIDILGGLMPDAADKTAIQFKVLNSSKGPAVWALRVQSDKRKYSAYIRQKLEQNQQIDIIQDEVIDFTVADGKISSVSTLLHRSIKTKACIICAGTFLDGKIFIGDQTIPSGRLGEAASCSLSEILSEKFNFEKKRLKTGTPPRITKESINFEGMEKHGSDENILNFCFRNEGAYIDQVPCFITYTNPKTHALIEQNFGKTALFSGIIEGVGPRYCPSIEDKVNRFSERDSHRLFIEPEGLETNEYYINGFSTSLPLTIQIEALKTVRGFENAHFVRPAYAIEYDYFPSYQIKSTLETKKIKGLYFAGQINGTSGYEEAAAQGLMAGLNASLAIAGKEEFILGRNEAYIGVLIDDLITKDIEEPYRMFTSLAEYRLELRHDNADVRLLKYAEKYNLLSKQEIDFLKNRIANIEQAYQEFSEIKIPLKDLNEMLGKMNLEPAKEGLNLFKLLKNQNITIENIIDYQLDKNTLTEKYSLYELKQAEILAKYEGYIKRQQEIIKKANKNERIKLAYDLNYDSFTGLKIEAREKLKKIRPLSIGQAGRIAGISPADISVVIVNLKKMGLI